MKVDIFSRDAGFLRSCRVVLESWSKFVCVDLDLTTVDRGEDLCVKSQTEQRMLFLDAECLNMSESLEQLETVREAYDALFVCAQNSQKAIALYRLRPTAFLSRPVSVDALDRAMSRCVAVWQNGLRRLEVTENRSRLKVPMCDILWAEALGRSCLLHCLCRDIQVGESMNELSVKLPEDVFVRCQRSYLVNLHHVRDTDGKFVYMTNGEAISIGRSIRPGVLSALEQYRTCWNKELE